MQFWSSGWEAPTDSDSGEEKLRVKIIMFSLTRGLELRSKQVNTGNAQSSVVLLIVSNKNQNETTTNYIVPRPLSASGKSVQVMIS